MSGRRESGTWRKEFSEYFGGPADAFSKYLWGPADAFLGVWELGEWRTRRVTDSGVGAPTAARAYRRIKLGFFSKQWRLARVRPTLTRGSFQAGSGSLPKGIFL